MDFPFYDGRPAPMSVPLWLLVLATVGLAFYLLTGPVLASLPEPWAGYVASVLFPVLPLLALHLVSRGHATALFLPYGPKSFGISLGFAILTIGTSAVVALLLAQLSSFNDNPSSGMLAAMNGTGLAVFLSRTFFQLIGEEVVTILPLLAVLWFCVQKLKMPKGWALAVAVLVSTAWFSAMHLATYDWNVLQCFAVIGSARLLLTTAYLVTRNLWVSAGAHIINDWSIFIITFAGSHMPVAS